MFNIVTISCMYHQQETIRREFRLAYVPNIQVYDESSKEFVDATENSAARLRDGARLRAIRPADSKLTVARLFVVITMIM